MTPLTPAEMDAKITRYAAEYPEAFDDQTTADWFESLAARQRAQVVVTDAAPAHVDKRWPRQREQIAVIANWLGATTGTVIDSALSPQQSHEAATWDAIRNVRRAARDEAKR